MNTNRTEKGNAVITRGSKVIGIVGHVDRAMGLAWVIWPDRCGLSECQPIDHLQTVCDRETITQALQVIAPVSQLTNPLERAFLAGASQSSASTQIVDADDFGIVTRDGGGGEPRRPYYRSRNR